ncbi:MAG: ribonuclease H-like domain-containing protein [Patescibacteria group bacterium]
MASDTVVFDLETKKQFSDVGGRENLHLLEVSALSAYSYEKDKFYEFEEKDLKFFEQMAKDAERVVGFNIKGFDLPVLQPYVSIQTSSLPVVDMMDDVVRGVGFRVSLDNLCKTTLGAGKIADGLDAVRWWREGKIDEIKKYCTEDVRLTRDLYEYGKRHGHVLFHARDSAGRVSVPVSWAGENSQNIRQILVSAFQSRSRVEINYLTKTSEAGEDPNKTRLVDIYKIGEDEFEGYCHLRKGLRIFKIERVLAARPTGESYRVPGEMQESLL